MTRVGQPANADRFSDSDALIGEIDRAGSIVRSSIGADSPLSARLVALRDRLQRQHLQIAVLGQFKRGKSTFINALLHAPVLPTGVVPITAIPTFISWGESPSIRVQFSGRTPAEQFTADDADTLCDILGRFVTEDANSKNRLGVERVELFYPAELLAGGTILIDTPGIGSTLAHNTEAALRILPECDASLFIVSVDPPITEAELGYLRRLRPGIGRIFFVINKIDYLAPDDQIAVSRFLRKALVEEATIEPATQIFGVSARLGLSASGNRDGKEWRRSGMADIEDQLIRYLAKDKAQALCGAIRRKAADILVQADNDLRLRAKALEMPFEQLLQKSSEFEQTLESIEIEWLTIGDLLSGDRRRLLGELETRIQSLRDEASSQLKGTVDDALSHAKGNREEKIKSSVSAAIEDVFGAARADFVDAFSRRAGDALANRRHRLDELIDEVRRTAAKMFQVTFAPESEPEAFRLVQEPYWVSERIASTLIPDLRPVIDRLLPGPVRQKRLRARILAEANELIVRNAESLRWTILRGLDETFRAASSQLDERLGDATAATKGVIEDALGRRRNQSFIIQAALQRLERAKQELSAARSKLLSCEETAAR
jgi:Dynamin family